MCGFEYVFFSASSKSLLPARTLNILTLRTSILHQRLTHTPSQKVCDLSILLARRRLNSKGLKDVETSIILCNGRFYEILTLRNTMLCILVRNYEFTATIMNLEAVILSETLVTNYKSERRYIIYNSN